MILQSVLIGLIFGAFWASIFIRQYNVQKCKIQATTALAFSALIRTLLLIIILIFLLSQKYIVIWWWLIGFLTTFWLLLFSFVLGKKNEN